MASPLPSFPPFDVHGEGSINSKWSKWLKRFENLMVAMDITQDKRKRALLLHYAGSEVDDIFDTLDDTGAETDYKKATDALKKYFEPQKNREFEIYRFRQAKQSPGENLDQYHTKLRQLAESCDFADKEKEIKTQIIQNSSSAKLRRQALSKPTWKLSDLLQSGRMLELAGEQAAGIEGIGVTSQHQSCAVNAVSKTTKGGFKQSKYHHKEKQEQKNKKGEENALLLLWWHRTPL